MEHHNIGWMMLAVVTMVTMALFCGHFGIGLNNSFTNSTMPTMTLGKSLGWGTVSWMFTALTFNFTASYGAVLSSFMWFLAFIVLWCVTPLIISVIQALGTWVP